MSQMRAGKMSLRERLRDAKLQAAYWEEQMRVTFAYVETRRVLLDRETKRWKACLKAARILRRRRAI